MHGDVPMVMSPLGVSAETSRGEGAGNAQQKKRMERS